MVHVMKLQWFYDDREQLQCCFISIEFEMPVTNIGEKIFKDRFSKIDTISLKQSETMID